MMSRLTLFVLYGYFNWNARGGKPLDDFYCRRRCFQYDTVVILAVVQVSR